MPPENQYENNTPHKDRIRIEWVRYSREIPGINVAGGIKLLTLPSSEMQDIRKFVDEGLISWEQRETGGFEITKGKVVCFETVPTKYTQIRQTLIGANTEVISGEIGQYIQTKYRNLRGKLFPFDVINLDFDGCLSKIRSGIDETLNCIIDLQALDRANFSLFLTYPVIQESDEQEEDFMTLMENTLRENLEGATTQSFREQFEAQHGSRANMNHASFLAVCVAKRIIHHAARHGYRITASDFYTYQGGAQGVTQMISQAFNFEHTNRATTHDIYPEQVLNALGEITTLE